MLRWVVRAGGGTWLTKPAGKRPARHLARSRSTATAVRPTASAASVTVSDSSSAARASSIDHGVRCLSPPAVRCAGSRRSGAVQPQSADAFVIQPI
ncbi:hypothetical protein I552_0448 [Mycobacterium xenopi 3993]|nr:hypothetical protein I552_0448 [Mycobacterium xenopi 3993]